MMRTRLLWFTVGAAMTGAAVTHFVYKDYWVERQSMVSQLLKESEALESRVTHLESLGASPTPPQDHK